jgi:short-subunit dehydrogenase
MELRNATVLVTGATGGIGQAIARTLAEKGASLVLSGRRADVLEPLAKELDARTIVADLAQRTDVHRLIEECADVDIVVANAALPSSGPALELTEEQIARSVEVNLTAPMLMAVAMAPAMLERGKGHFVFISSLSGKASVAGTALYSATKFGLRGFALGLREDLDGTGVGSSLVLPGFVRDAGMFANTGVTPPPGIRTVTPQAVADNVVKAIEQNRPELVVAPFEARLATAFAGAAPRPASVISKFIPTESFTNEIAEAQRNIR